MINEVLDGCQTHMTREPWPQSTEQWWIQGYTALCKSSLYRQVSGVTGNTSWCWWFGGCSAAPASVWTLLGHHPSSQGSWGGGILNELSLSFPLWKRLRERALGARVISSATSGKTQARDRSHLHRSAHCLWRQGKARSLARLLLKNRWNWQY